jgi:hypothetical protein
LYISCADAMTSTGCHSCGNIPHVTGCPLTCVFVKDFRRNIGEAKGVVVSGFRLAVDGTWGFIFLRPVPRGLSLGIPFTTVVTDPEALWVWRASVRLSEHHRDDPIKFLDSCDKLDWQGEPPPAHVKGIYAYLCSCVPSFCNGI